jgi:ribulose-5-phosphate 4-epimerase/fuculose-1-phosphate aldolase
LDAGAQEAEVGLAAAARVLADRGLVDAFGHVSVRHDRDTMLITPPRPLGTVGPDAPFVVVELHATELPDGAPKEAWMHLAVYRRRGDVGAICRAQPEVATAMAIAGRPLTAVHGQGALLGQEVPVFDDARLVRDPARAEALATSLGAAPALVLRGNGALTTGARLGHAVARMTILETSARLHRDAAAVGGPPVPLAPAELAAWVAAGDELLDRLWHHLRG